MAKRPTNDQSPHPRRPRKILAVDDDEAVLQLAAACVAHGLGQGYQVAFARSGQEALDAVARERPDLILLDVMMPGLDGFEVCRRLRASPATRDIPILFLTGAGDHESVDRGLAAGGDGYVVKPFNAAVLATQIAELLPP